MLQKFIENLYQYVSHYDFWCYVELKKSLK